MTEKAIGTVTENAEAIASAVTRTGLGSRGMVIAGSFMLATALGVGVKFGFGKVKTFFSNREEVEVVEEDNVTDISEAVTRLAEENED